VANGGARAAAAAGGRISKSRLPGHQARLDRCFLPRLAMLRAFPKNRVPKRLTPKLKWMKGVKMTEIFRSTGKCRTFEAFLPCRLRPPSQVEALAGSTAQRAANEDDPGFDPPAGHLWRPLPRWLRVGQSFPWIGTPMTVAGTSMPPAPPQAWPLQPA
jgi:hypothetical protein